MGNPKYIIYQGFAYIFPSFVDHEEFAIRNKFDMEDIDGAGFVCMTDRGPACYGESISLSITSRESLDTACVERLFVY